MAVVLLIAALFAGVPRTPEAQALFAPADGYGFGVGAAMTWMSTVDADRELDVVADTADRPSSIPSAISTPPILTATRTTSAR